MRRDLSAYLDLLRLGAAVAVMFSHIGWQLLTGGFLWQLKFIGADAVVIFFVLSGFVISYAADTKEKTLIDYQIARLARLYSVVIPALILTYLFDKVGIAHSPHSYLLNLEDNPILRLAAGATFLSQCWTWDLSLLSNNPFWSLCYEFWYYQIFAAALFFRGLKRIALIVLCCAIVGPPILIYLPLWLLGVGAYWLTRATVMERLDALILFLLSLIGLIAIIWCEYKGWIVRNGGGYLPRAFSPVDYLTAFLVGLNIYAASFVRLPLLGGGAKVISECASVTFALYLLHLPIFHLLAAFTPIGLSNTQRGLILLFGGLVIVVGLSFVTERRKKEWRIFFRWVLAPNEKSAQQS